MMGTLSGKVTVCVDIFLVWLKFIASKEVQWHKITFSLLFVM